MSTRYQFRIRNRQGLVLDRLLIQGRDRGHAEAKIRQMYVDCEILECVEGARPRGVGEMLTMGHGLPSLRVHA